MHFTECLQTDSTNTQHIHNWGLILNRFLTIFEKTGKTINKLNPLKF